MFLGVIFGAEIFITVVVCALDGQLRSQTLGSHLIDPDTIGYLYSSLEGAAVAAVIGGCCGLGAGLFGDDPENYHDAGQDNYHGTVGPAAGDRRTDGAVADGAGNQR